MLKIYKYLKPYLFLVIFLIIFVIIEVISELALPECMGDMISDGIEQFGINNYIPVVINKKTREDILSLSTQENKKLVLKSYKKLTKQSQLENNIKFKNIELDFKNKDIYINLNKNKKELEALDKNLFNIFLIFESEKNINIKNIILKNTGLKANKNIIYQINNKNKILKIIDNNINKIKKDQVSSLILKKIKNSYDKINLDVKILQKNYIKQKSKQMLIYILLADVSWVFIIFITSICSSGVARNLKRDLFKSVMNFSKLEIDKFSVSSLITRTTNDINQIQDFIFYFLENIFFAPMFGVIAFKKVYEKNIEISWAILIIILILLVLISVILFLVIPKFNLVQKLIDKINLVTRESLTGVLSIRAFNTQKFEEKKFEERNYELKKTKWYIEKIMNLMNPLIFFIVNISMVIIVWISYKYIFKSEFQVGDIIVYINYTMNVIFSFLMMSMMFVEIPRASVSARRVLEVLNTKSSVLDTQNKINKADFKGEICFKNVSFLYPGAKEFVLKNISFEIKPGQTTAFIGSTGSGKSTLVNLIFRFYDVSDGEILLDKVNIKNISLETLRNQISYAPQKGILFKGTIESNIKYGDEKAANKKIREVAKIAQAQDFINQKQDKFLSKISQRGENISGGQRQRLSIARALLKKSKIYIFDDSFSALDFNTDFKIRKAISNYLKQVAVVIVAQRVSTVINADKIIVLEKGQIVGQGTHKELLKTCKEYFEIASNQLPEDLLK